MSALNTLLCGGHEAQPPERKYEESCFLWDTHLCVSLTCITVAQPNTCSPFLRILTPVHSLFLWNLFFILDFNVCFMSEIAQALHHMPWGVWGYFFFFMLSLHWLVGQLKRLQRETENILWNTYCMSALQSRSVSHIVWEAALKWMPQHV